MARVGAYEAKTHLSKLLERVARGERITITKHDVPVAELVPPAAAPQRPLSETIEALRRFRSRHTLGELSITRLKETGRR